MLQHRGACPQCGTVLRVKDRAYLDRPIACPGCRATLILKSQGDDGLQVTLAAKPAAVDEPSRLPAPDRHAAWLKSLVAWSTNVTVVSWAATLLVAAMVGVVMLNSQTKPSAPNRRNPAAISKSRPPYIVPQDLTAAIAATELDDPAESTAGSQPVDEQAAQLEGPIADAPIVASAEVTSDEPLEAPLTPEPEPAQTPRTPPVDFDRALGQPFVRFRQERAVPRRELLELLEELLGAPIRYDHADLEESATALDQKLTFDLKNTTVGKVLDKVLDNTDLVYDRERDSLRLRRRDTTQLKSAPSPD